MIRLTYYHGFQVQTISFRRIRSNMIFCIWVNDSFIRITRYDAHEPLHKALFRRSDVIPIIRSFVRSWSRFPSYLIEDESTVCLNVCMTRSVEISFRYCQFQKKFFYYHACQNKLIFLIPRKLSTYYEIHVINVSQGLYHNWFYQNRNGKKYNYASKGISF